jgi:hypothetical protein
MASEVKWETAASSTVGIAGDASSPTLKNLASAAGIVGSEIDNTDGHQMSAWQLRVRGDTAFTAGEYVQLFFLLAIDGTNYEDGSTTVQPAKAAAVTFPMRAVDTQCVITIDNVILPPCKFKPLIWNATARGWTNTDDENQLRYITYNAEGQ